MSEIIGLDAIAAFPLLIQTIPEISAVKVFDYQAPPLAQARLGQTLGESHLLEKALTIRNNYKMPFWDALLVSCFSAEETPISILEAARFHASHRSLEKEITRNEIINGKLNGLVGATASNSWLALVSEIRKADASSAHLPLIDFHIPCSSQNQKTVLYILRWLLPDGFILLTSGRSYHAWGCKIIEPPQMMDFLARSLLYCPIVDRAYIAHQLIEGRSALRISACGVDKPAPRVIFTNCTSLLSYE